MKRKEPMPSLFGGEEKPAPVEATPVAPEKQSIQEEANDAPFDDSVTVTAVEEPATDVPAHIVSGLPEVIKEEATSLGIDIAKAQTLIGNLPQITAERDSLAMEYDRVMKLDLEDPKTAKVAKELRIKIRDNRTKGISVWHSTTKDYYLKAGQFVDAIKRKEIAVNERMEENLEKIEKHLEIKRKKEEQELREKRVAELEQYKEFVPMGVDLGTLSEPEYLKVFNGAKLQYDFDKQQKEEEERKRKEEEEKKAAKDARIKKLLPFKHYLPDWDNFDFDSMTDEQTENHIADARALYEKKKAEYEESQKILAEENRKKEIREARAKELQPYIVFIRDYNALIEMEEEAYQKQFADIKKGAELQWEEDRKKMAEENQMRAKRIDRAKKLNPYLQYIKDYDAVIAMDDERFKSELVALETVALLDKQEQEEKQKEQERIKEENDKLQKELADKKKAEDEQRKKELAEQKRLSNAPDSKILTEISDRIKVFPASFPEVKSPEAKEMLEEAIAIIKKVGADLAAQAKSLTE